MPALGGAAAEQLRFMDFLLRDPVRSILLHGAGVSVVIPAPERYAVHKLIVAGWRQRDAGGRAKADKDLRRAGMLFDALQSTGVGAYLLMCSVRRGAGGHHGKVRSPTGLRQFQKSIIRPLIGFMARFQHSKRKCLLIWRAFLYR